MALEAALANETPVQVTSHVAVRVCPHRSPGFSLSFIGPLTGPPVHSQHAIHNSPINKKQDGRLSVGPAIL